MNIEIDEALYRKLEQRAREQGRDVAALTNDIVQEYFHADEAQEAFRAQVRRVMEKHSELLDKLK